MRREKRHTKLGHEKKKERERERERWSFLYIVLRQHLGPGNYCILTESTFAKEGYVIMSETFIIPTTPFYYTLECGMNLFS
jgi:hypothetical protein